MDSDIEAKENTDEVVGTGRPSNKAYNNAPSYLVPAFLIAMCYIVLCGFYAIPFLIVAIVYGFKVNIFLQKEQYEDAKRASRLAMIWCWVSFGVWIIIGGIFLIAAAIQAYNDGL